ncbi:flavodoxin [Terrabacter aeriphilus]|uniref:flavodoxin n=1 Tax=Terrabacter aeriphilus TaxID=515662 RepID=UPI0031E59649
MSTDHHRDPRVDHGAVLPGTSRRTVLRGAVVGGALALTGTQAACSTGGSTAGVPRASSNAATGTASESAAESSAPGDRPRPRVLVAYFSRPGENYYYGGRRDLPVGNTEVLARMIAQRLRCDIHRIEALDPYSRGYDDTVARNVREQDADARPGIGNRLPSIRDYDVVLLGSSIWNVRPPMIMHTFAESLGFTGTTVHPFTTHAMSGLGTTEREYAAACRGATVGEGLAVKGEEVANADQAVSAWLTRINLQTGTPS